MPTPLRSDLVVVRGVLQSPQHATYSADVLVIYGGAIQIDDLPALIPGLWLVNDQDPGTNILSIRGATTDRLQQASVAMVVDGVPLADTEFFTGPLFDLRTVAVVRGPQGAMFGKNAAGGALLVQTEVRGPGFFELTAGDGGLLRTTGAIVANQSSGGIDTTARAAVLYSRQDGWIENRTLGRKVDGQELTALRLTGAASNIGPWTLEARASWMEERGGAAWASSGNVTGLAGGRLDGAVLTDPIGDYEGRAWRTWTQGSLTAFADFDFGSVRLIVARDMYAKRWREELDYRPGPLTFFGVPAFPNGIQPISQPVDVAAWTGEASWTRESGNWRFQVGIFAQDTRRRRVDEFGPLLFGAPAPVYDSRGEQRAVFGGITYDNNSLQLEAQLRFDEDQRSQTITSSATGALIEQRSGSFSRLQPRVAVAYDLDDLDVLDFEWMPMTRLRASYGEAFRPGGFNPVPGPTSIWSSRFRPEITRSVEVGIWFRFENSRLSGAVFRNSVDDFQSYTFLDGQSVTLNVPDVTVEGFELEFSMLSLPSPGGSNGRLGLALAWNDARIGRFIATDPLLGSPATRDYSGRQVPNAPRWTGSLTYDWYNDEETIFGVISLNGAGRTVYELDNVLYSPARAWLDVELEWLPAQRSDWSVELDVKNATDERWAVSAFGQGMLGLLAGLGPGGPFDTFTINRGRQISLTLRYEF